MNSMKVNILHRTSSEAGDFKAFCLQQEIAHRAGVKTTMQLVPSALDSSDIIAYAMEQHAEYGDEIAIGLHELLSDEIKDKFKTKEFAIYLQSFDNKKAIITHVFDKFKSVFGSYPDSVGAYILDAQTLTWLKGAYPNVKTAVTNCFEEGIHMFTGCKHQWYLFSEGGPWGAYYPSKENSLCPARSKENDCGIIGVSHLNRDMLMAITSRDDYFSSHPANVLRGRANDGDECAYNYRFIDQWIGQLEYNGFGYYNIFVGTQWFKPGKNFEEHHEDSIKLYEDALVYLKKKEAAGQVEIMTMGEYADWHRTNIAIGTPEVNLWSDILCGSKRQMAWYCDPSFRVAIDPNAGGAISDLRPLAGQIEKNLGPETKSLYKGSYPFLISIEHRGGFNEGSIHTYDVTFEGKTISARERRTTCTMERDKQGNHTVIMAPVEFKFDGLSVSVASQYTFKGNGKIEIERRIVDMSDSAACVQLKEFHRGCYGDTPYAEDMNGIELSIAASDGTIKDQLIYAYQCRESRIDNPSCVKAVIPQVQCRVSLSPADGERADSGAFEEGYLFRPFYTLILDKKVRKGECLKSWLTIEKK